MASAILNLRIKTARTSRCSKQLVQFLRDNRWPVEIVQVTCRSNGKTDTRKWNVDQYPPDLLEDILRFITNVGDDVNAEIEISEGGF